MNETKKAELPIQSFCPEALAWLPRSGCGHICGPEEGGLQANLTSSKLLITNSFLHQVNYYTLMRMFESLMQFVCCVPTIGSSLTKDWARSLCRLSADRDS